MSGFFTTENYFWSLRFKLLAGRYSHLSFSGLMDLEYRPAAPLPHEDGQTVTKIILRGKKIIEA
jgi:hypothetical protein